METFTQSDFSGGMSDRYLSAAQNQFYLSDNYLIDVDGKIYGRNGYDIYSTAVVAGASIYQIYIGQIPYNYPLVSTGQHLYKLNASPDGFTEIVGPAGNFVFPGGTGPGQGVFWQKQLICTGGTGLAASSNSLPVRIVATSYTPTFIAYTLGLPLPASGSIVNTPTAAGTTYTYNYALHYDYQFTDLDGTLYEERSGVIFWQVQTSSPIGGGCTNNITGLPVLANTAYTNYDTANVKLKLFRTVNNGSSYFSLGSINNGTTTYSDTSLDTAISGNAAVYASGGVLAWSPPPTGALYVTQTSGVFWWATASLLQQSNVGAPGGCPGQNAQTFDQTIKGLSTVLSFPIVFCDRSIYRIEGQFDAEGANGFIPREINQTAGCISNLAIVRVPGGLVWPGNGGFYFTDGYQVIRISNSILERYNAWQAATMQGVYDSTLNVVYWTVSTSSSQDLLVLHLNFGLIPESVFTTHSFSSVNPNAIAFSESSDILSKYRSKLLIGDQLGFLLYQDPNAFTDPAISLNYYPSQMKKKAIIYDFQSRGLDFSGPAYRAYTTYMSVETKGITDIAFSIQTRRDDGGAWAALAECRQDGVITWGYSNYAWGDTSYSHPWGSTPMGAFKRGMPSGQLRTNKAQIRFTNSATPITNSDLLGLCNVNSTSRLVTLVGGGIWPYDCEDYLLSFVGDGYTNRYIVKNRQSDTVLEVFDPLVNLSTVNGTKWQMKGIQKYTRLYMQSYTVYFEQEGMTQSPPTVTPLQNV